MMTEPSSTYELTPDDLALVQSLMERMTEQDRPNVLKINLRSLELDKERREKLIRELRAVDRAILVREAMAVALEKL